MDNKQRIDNLESINNIPCSKESAKLVLDILKANGLQPCLDWESSIDTLVEGGVSICVYDKKYVYTTEIYEDGDNVLSRYAIKKDERPIVFEFNNLVDFEEKLKGLCIKKNTISK